MSECSVTRCPRSRVATVTFDEGGTWDYCRYHAYDRDHALRWSDRLIADVARWT